MGFGNPVRPLARSVLYPHNLNQYATPKDISERTSYHQIRLAFHPYPHLIQCFFNNNQFGPPLEINRASSWTWIDHLASGLLYTTLKRPIQTRFRYDYTLHMLNLAIYSNSPVHSTKGTLSYSLHIYTQYRTLTVCKHTVSGSISLPALGFFSRFPSRYLLAIGR